MMHVVSLLGVDLIPFILEYDEFHLLHNLFHQKNQDLKLEYDSLIIYHDTSIYKNAILLLFTMIPV